MKQYSLLVLFAIISLVTNAKVWRINNTPGVSADFTSCQAALSSPSVVNDDTLHIEGSAITYGGFTLDKRLVIIGPGYFISGTDANTGLQASPYTCNFGAGAILLDSTSSGSVIMGLDNIYVGVGPNLGSATDNVTITRCYVSSISLYYGFTPNTKMTGWKVNKCYINSIDMSSVVTQNWEVTNNLMGLLNLYHTDNLNNLVRNNVIRSPINLFNAYFANNIITGTTFNTANTAIKNNISTGTNLPAGNGNLNGASDATLFQGLSGNSIDGQWRLKPGSPAIGAGETVGGVTPDCGAFGTADPYRLSGIPPIPTIYQLTVPAAVATNATTMPITISTRSNN